MRLWKIFYTMKKIIHEFLIQLTIFPKMFIKEVRFDIRFSR